MNGRRERDIEGRESLLSRFRTLSRHFSSLWLEDFRYLSCRDEAIIYLDRRRAAPSSSSSSAVVPRIPFGHGEPGSAVCLELDERDEVYCSPGEELLRERERA